MGRPKKAIPARSPDVIGEYAKEPVDRSGINIYVHLIRGSEDPERTPRREAGDHLRDTLSLWRRRLMKDSAETWAERILAYLSADELPRTFNRIAVEMIDKTADIVHGSPFEDGLWLLVERKQVEHTIAAPVYFRIRKDDVDGP